MYLVEHIRLPRHICIWEIFVRNEDDARGALTGCDTMPVSHFRDIWCRDNTPANIGHVHVEVSDVYVVP